VNNPFTIECQVCGQNLELEYPQTGDAGMDRLLLKVAKGCVHDRCFNERRHANDEAQEVERITARSQAWPLLCEPYYQNCTEWIKTGEAMGKLNMPSVRQALEWQYNPKGLLLHGKQSGTGKTTSMWCIMHREFIAGRFIVKVSHTELAKKAIKISFKSEPGIFRWAHTLKTSDILFIDDLGKARFKSADGEGRASEEFLFDIFAPSVSIEEAKNFLPRAIELLKRVTNYQKNLIYLFYFILFYFILFILFNLFILFIYLFIYLFI